MNILMVYPEFKLTFWNYRDIVRKFLGKKAAFTPAGLLQIADKILLEKSWNIKLIDLNVKKKLRGKEIKWADYVFVSAMDTQRDSTREVIAHCKMLGKPVILGGPIIQEGCDEFFDITRFYGEAEGRLPELLSDLGNGTVKKVYYQKSFPDLFNSSPSFWKLINPFDYALPISQIGKGCPFGCTFCDVVYLNGRPRLRPESVIVAELDELYQTGYRGAVYFADDNIIGNKSKAKNILAKLAEWQKKREYPFEFTGEFDITLADDSELMNIVVAAGFKKVFLGLETFNKASLVECGKLQNSARDIFACVKRIQEHGLIPMSGFIVGFDEDDPDTFDEMMISGIQNAGIVIAMVGVLQAPYGSKLYKKLEQEGRLLTQWSGNNTDSKPNFLPKMPLKKLVQKFKNIWGKIYLPKEYYKTICNFRKNYDPSNRPKKKSELN